MSASRHFLPLIRRIATPARIETREQHEGGTRAAHGRREPHPEAPRSCGRTCSPMGDAHAHAGGFAASRRRRPMHEPPTVRPTPSASARRASPPLLPYLIAEQDSARYAKERRPVSPPNPATCWPTASQTRSAANRNPNDGGSTCTTPPGCVLAYGLARSNNGKRLRRCTCRCSPTPRPIMNGQHSACGDCPTYARSTRLRRFCCSCGPAAGRA